MRELITRRNISLGGILGIPMTDRDRGQAMTDSQMVGMLSREHVTTFLRTLQELWN